MTGERGVTLIEILVAMAVFALGLSAFLQANLLSLRLRELSLGIAEATTLAQEGVEEIEAWGWEEAVADCTPESGDGGGAERAWKRVARGGRLYRLRFERDELSPRLDGYRVTCVPEGPRADSGAIPPLTLVTARRRP